MNLNIASIFSPVMWLVMLIVDNYFIVNNWWYKVVSYWWLVFYSTNNSLSENVTWRRPAIHLLMCVNRKKGLAILFVAHKLVKAHSYSSINIQKLDWFVRCPRDDCVYPSYINIYVSIWRCYGRLQLYRQIRSIGRLSWWLDMRYICSL